MTSSSVPLPPPTDARGLGLRLRPWRASDEQALAAMADDPLLRQWSPLSRDATGVAGWIAKRAVWDDHLSWAVVDDADRLLAGVSVWQFDPVQASASVGYWTAPTQRGRGVAAMATRVATAFAFRTTAIERLTCFHAVENIASCHVATRAGFLFEGTLRQSWRYPDGRLHDEHLHALLRDDPGVLDALER